MKDGIAGEVISSNFVKSLTIYKDRVCGILVTIQWE